MWGVVLPVAILLGFVLFGKRCSIRVWFLAFLGTLVLGVFFALLLPFILPSLALLMVEGLIEQLLTYLVLTVIGFVVGIVVGYGVERL